MDLIPESSLLYAKLQGNEKDMLEDCCKQIALKLDEVVAKGDRTIFVHFRRCILTELQEILVAKGYLCGPHIEFKVLTI